MNLPRNEANRPFRLEDQDTNQRAPPRALARRLIDNENISLGSRDIGENAFFKTRRQVKQSSPAAAPNHLSCQVSIRRKIAPGSRRRGRVNRRELTEMADVVARLPALATRPAFDGKTVTPLAMVLRSDDADLLLVRRIVETTIRHWAAQNYHMTKHPTSECYPLNIPAEIDGKLPLHVACEYGKSDIVRYIASTYPHALTRRDNRGRLPIHTACAFGADKDITSYLASVRPDTLWMADRNGRLPIHIACACGDKVTIDYLGAAYRQALAVPDRHGRLPIHIACSTGHSDAIIAYLASAYPEALAKPDKDGKLPIDLVLEKRGRGAGPSLPTIKKMLMHCPESLSVVKGNTKSSALGRLLFRNYAELEVLKTMVEVFPDAAPGSEVHLVAENPATGALVIDTDHSIEIAKLFGKVESLHLEARTWTQRAFCRFMEQLGRAPASFRKLSVTLPAYDLSKQYSDTRDAFERAMAQNQSLSELRLGICQDDVGSIRETKNDIMLLKSLSRGLKMRGRPLGRLELIGFAFSDVNGLVDLLEHNSALVDIEPILPSSNRKLQAKYEYFMSLNKCGRGELRDKECRLGSFVSLISKVPRNETGLLYGLLLERPDLWSCSFDDKVMGTHVT